jgi:hypothetical protein
MRRTVISRRVAGRRSGSAAILAAVLLSGSLPFGAQAADDVFSPQGYYGTINWQLTQDYDFGGTNAKVDLNVTFVLKGLEEPITASGTWTEVRDAGSPNGCRSLVTTTLEAVAVTGADFLVSFDPTEGTDAEGNINYFFGSLLAMFDGTSTQVSQGFDFQAGQGCLPGRTDNIFGVGNSIPSAQGVTKDRSSLAGLWEVGDETSAIGHHRLVWDLTTEGDCHTGRVGALIRGGTASKPLMASVVDFNWCEGDNPTIQASGVSQAQTALQEFWDTLSAAFIVSGGYETKPWVVENLSPSVVSLAGDNQLCFPLVGPAKKVVKALIKYGIKAFATEFGKAWVEHHILDGLECGDWWTPTFTLSAFESGMALTHEVNNTGLVVEELQVFIDGQPAMEPVVLQADGSLTLDCREAALGAYECN